MEFRTVTITDALGFRGAPSRQFLATPQGVVEFTGEDISPVLKVDSRHFIKNGKWSHTSWTAQLADCAEIFTLYRVNGSWVAASSYDGAIERIRQAMGKADALKDLSRNQILKFLWYYFPEEMSSLKAREEAFIYNNQLAALLQQQEIAQYNGQDVEAIHENLWQVSSEKAKERFSELKAKGDEMKIVALTFDNNTHSYLCVSTGIDSQCKRICTEAYAVTDKDVGGVFEVMDHIEDRKTGARSFLVLVPVEMEFIVLNKCGYEAATNDELQDVEELAKNANFLGVFIHSSTEWGKFYSVGPRLILSIYYKLLPGVRGKWADALAIRVMEDMDTDNTSVVMTPEEKAEAEAKAKADAEKKEREAAEKAAREKADLEKAAEIKDKLLSKAKDGKKKGKKVVLDLSDLRNL